MKTQEEIRDIWNRINHPTCVADYALSLDANDLKRIPEGQVFLAACRTASTKGLDDEALKVWMRATAAALSIEEERDGSSD
jgi:hypothetical protein